MTKLCCATPRSFVEPHVNLTDNEELLIFFVAPQVRDQVTSKILRYNVPVLPFLLTPEYIIQSLFSSDAVDSCGPAVETPRLLNIKVLLRLTIHQI
jgi:hypothetical protein